MNKIDWSKAPADATHYIAESDSIFGCWLKPGYAVRVSRGTSDWVRSDYADGLIATSAIKRPWSGEGLPPVGVVCEAAIPHISGPNDERSFIWIEGSVIAYYEIKGKTYAWFAEDDGFYPPSILEFRPVRTPEQIAAGERDKVAHELFRSAWPETHSWGDLSPHWQEAFYRLADAGYRKP